MINPNTAMRTRTLSAPLEPADLYDNYSNIAADVEQFTSELPRRKNMSPYWIGGGSESNVYDFGNDYVLKYPKIRRSLERLLQKKR